MNKAELDRILRKHEAWLKNAPHGEQANLRKADLLNELAGFLGLD